MFEGKEEKEMRKPTQEELEWALSWVEGRPKRYHHPECLGLKDPNLTEQCMCHVKAEIFLAGEVRSLQLQVLRAAEKSEDERTEMFNLENAAKVLKSVIDNANGIVQMQQSNLHARAKAMTAKDAALKKISGMSAGFYNHEWVDSAKSALDINWKDFLENK